MRFCRRAALLLVFAGALVLTALAQDRDPNARLNFPPVPGTQGYRFDPAFSGVVFMNPVAIATPPGETNRIFVVEQPGRISVITNLAAPTRTTFLDLQNATAFGGEEGLLGLAFHPRFAENGRFFVYRTVTASTRGSPNMLHDRLSEFHVSAGNPDKADTLEKILLQQADQAGNHNAGDVHFGPDGYLYLSLGDEGGANDQFQNAQKIDHDFFGAILRLDIDARPGSLPANSHPANEDFPGNYRVPPDNPFVGVTKFNTHTVDPKNVRTEFWSVGWRNPWRMSFDPATGELWVGNVGQDAIESVAVTHAGANHGWSYVEGDGPGPFGAPPGFRTDPQFGWVPPIYSYPHGGGAFQGNSVTGGVVYRGARLASLVGAYVFADYVDGNVWSLRRQPTGKPTVERLGNQPNVSAFGTDPRNGDLLLAHHTGNRIVRLVYDGTLTGPPLPSTLADTGAFADLAALKPIDAMVPYEVNLPFWSDGAVKTRWFFVPGTAQVGFTTNEAWNSPAGTVWMKHFEIETTVGDSSSRRRLETRFIVQGPSGVYGVTYRWSSPTTAELVPDVGADETLVINDGGTQRSQTWHYPGRGECLACHTTAAGGSLGFNTAQLNREGAAGVNQVARIAAAGYFSNPPGAIASLPRHASLPAPDGTPPSLEAQARSYLAANCSPCHRPGGTTPAFWDARNATPTDLTGIIMGRLNDSRGDDANRVVVPGDTAHSVLFQRMSTRGPGKMPPLASNLPDAAGAQLLKDWITSLPGRLSFADWAREKLNDTSGNPPPGLDSDGDGAVDLLEYLTGTDPKNPLDFWQPRIEHSPVVGQARLRLSQPAGVGLQVETTDRPDGVWMTWDDPSNVVFYPAVARELVMELPTGDSERLFRVRVLGR